MAKDPVCEMEIEADQAVASYEYKGKTYYFCAEGCKNIFVKNPEEFLN